MNVTQVQICNNALYRIGSNRRISSLGEGSAEADLLADVYTPCLERTLEAARWPFATKRANLAQIAPEDVGYLTKYPEYPYQYAWPADCLRALEVTNYQRAVTSDNAVRFRVESKLDGSARIIFTDQPAAVLVYIQRVTSVAAFPALFENALEWALAAELALGLSKDQKLHEWATRNWYIAVNNAFAVETNERVEDPPADAEWIRARS